MITVSASDPGKYKHGHATVRAVREGGCTVLTWIGGGHADPTPAHLDTLIATTRADGDATAYAVEEIVEVFKGRHGGDLVAAGKQEQRIVDHLTMRGYTPRRVQATKWRHALTGIDGPSDKAIEIVVCGLIRGAATAPLAKAEREHAYDAAGLCVYEIAVHMGLLTPLGRIKLPPHVEAALAVQLMKDTAERRAKREAKKSALPRIAKRTRSAS